MNSDKQITTDMWTSEGIDTPEGKLKRDQLVMKALQIPILFHSASFHHPEFQETSVVQFLRNDFLKSGKKCAVLMGDVGTGKSYGAMAFFINIIEAVIEKDDVKNMQGKFITAYELAELISRKEYVKLDRLKKVKVLFLDELGTEPEGWKGKDFQAHFENMFNSRYESGLITIVVTNFTPDKLAEHYGDRFSSRLAQYGQGFSTKDIDFRRKKG